MLGENLLELLELGVRRDASRVRGRASSRGMRYSA